MDNFNKRCTKYMEGKKLYNQIRKNLKRYRLEMERLENGIECHLDEENLLSIARNALIPELMSVITNLTEAIRLLSGEKESKE